MLLLFFSCLLVGFRSKGQRFGIGLAAAIAPEVKGVGWAVAFAAAAAGPCWSRGGLVSLFESQKPKGLGLGLAAAFALGDAASSGSLA